QPFEVAILIARLESLLRRGVWMKDGEVVESGSVAEGDISRRTRLGAEEVRGEVFSFGGKSIDFAELELRTLGNTIHLTVMEAEFLRYLVESGGGIVSRKSILEDVW